MKLTDTQLVILSAASQRDDRCAVLPPSLKGGAAQKVVARLLSEKLLEEIRARGTMPVFRRNADNIAYGLRITRTGLQAIRADEGEGQGSSVPAKGRVAPRRRQEPVATADTSDGPVNKDKPMGGKAAAVLALLSRPDGASIGELMAATGWLPHSTRAALSGLRKAGRNILRQRDDGGESRYRIIPADTEKGA